MIELAKQLKSKELKQVDIDLQFGCLYLQFSRKKVVRTAEHNDFAYVDLDKNKKLVGIEFVCVR